ncbi:MAG: lamin tail domain-containing protein [Phycisphaerales bacterium]
MKKCLSVSVAAAMLCAAGAAGPALADPTNRGKVIITEIFANPNDGGAGQINPAGADILEFIEIFNTTAEPIDISGWYLDDEDATAASPFPPGTIIGPRQAIAVIGVSFGLLPNDPMNPGQYLPQTPQWSPALFDFCWDPTPGDGSAPMRSVVIIPGNITIANTPTVFNEIPFLVDADGDVVDIANYQNAVDGWPAVTAGVSISLRPQFLNGVDNDRGCAWQLSNADPAALVSNETIFEFDPDGPGGNPPLTRDRFADAGNVASPGIVFEIMPAPSDCNNNGVDDFTETCGTSGSTVSDCNGNLIPDSCEPDCNANGVPDDCDASFNREFQDCNLNGIPDGCDINANGGAGGMGGTLDANSNGIIDGCEDTGRIVITEIQLEPTTSPQLEYVEIKNVSGGAVDISGYRVLDIEVGGDGYSLPVPEGTVLQAGEIAVLCSIPGIQTVEEATMTYQLLWGATTPQGQPIRFIPLGRWGARAANSTPTAEVLTLVRGAVIDDALVDMINPSSTSGPHPTRMNAPGGTPWVSSGGFVVDVANLSNANSNGEPLAGWPGTDGHSSFALLPGNATAADNNVGANWQLSIAGLNGARISNDLTGLPNAPAGVVSLGEDFGSPGFVPTGPNQVPSGDVIIAEIGATTNSVYPGSNPNPPQGQSVAGGRDEFLEVVNTTAGAIDISGWYLQDEDGRTQGFPAGTVLQPNEAAVVIGVDTFIPGGTNQPDLVSLDGRNFVQEFYDAWGCGYQVIPVTDWYTSNRAFGLDRLADAPSFQNEILRLVKADGTVADIANYDDDNTPPGIAQPPFGWPGDAVAAVDVFWSIYTLPGAYTQADNDLGINWAASLTGFEGGRQSVLNPAVDGTGFPTGLFNRSMFGSPGYVDLVTTNPIIPPGDDCLICPQDFNNDGNVDPDDLGDYINCYFSVPPCEGADINADGNVDPDDLGDFINLYFGPGC